MVSLWRHRPVAAPADARDVTVFTGSRRDDVTRWRRCDWGPVITGLRPAVVCVRTGRESSTAKLRRAAEASLDRDRLTRAATVVGVGSGTFQLAVCRSVPYHDGDHYSAVDSCRRRVRVPTHRCRRPERAFSFGRVRRRSVVYGRSPAPTVVVSRLQCRRN